MVLCNTTNVGRVDVVVTNRKATIVKADNDDFKALDRLWSYADPGARFKPSFIYGDWNGRIGYLKHNAVPAGLFRATKADATKLGIKFSTTYDREDVVFKQGFVEESAKYAYQNEAVGVMQRAVRKGGGLLLSATATGKTKTAAQFFSTLDCHCLFVVHRTDLMYQSQKEIASWIGKKVGVVGNSEYTPERVTVATVQTLSRHIGDHRFMDWYRQVKIVLVDELHSQMNRSNFSVLQEIKPVARFGLTATLQLKRKDVRLRAYAFAGPVLFEFPVSEGMEAKVLCRGGVLQLRFPLVEVASDGYQQEYENQVVINELKINTFLDILKLLLSHDRRVCVLVNRVEKPPHIQLLSSILTKNGIKHKLAYGKVGTEDRTHTRELFEEGKVNVILANSVFKEGINIKRLDAIIDMAEMPSKNDALQKFGRGVRLHPDKDYLFYIDFGTQDDRFGKAAKSRARAFKAAAIPIRSINIDSVKQAISEVRKELNEATTK